MPTKVKQKQPRRRVFTLFANSVSRHAGHPSAFIIALLMIVVWVVSGPFFGFSDTWQLVINTSTTIITFLMVFIIQNTQNRDTAALHLKVDELIYAMGQADNKFLDLEDLEEEDMEEVRTYFKKNAEKARKKPQKNGS